MSRLAVVPCDPESRGRYLGRKEIPANYMGDFSLPGFIVDPFPDACKLLLQAGYHLVELDGGADVAVDSPGAIREIQSLLSRSQIFCQFADVADTLYQA